MQKPFSISVGAAFPISSLSASVEYAASKSFSFGGTITANPGYVTQEKNYLDPNLSFRGLSYDHFKLYNQSYSALLFTRYFPFENLPIFLSAAGGYISSSSGSFRSYGVRSSGDYSFISGDIDTRPGVIVIPSIGYKHQTESGYIFSLEVLQPYLRFATHANITERSYRFSDPSLDYYDVKSKENFFINQVYQTGSGWYYTSVILSLSFGIAI
ncbi:hypothetical protein [Leptospira idonii]|uniref:Uncharacterized protein n=1 Tax=Leptospira idonii TaxID=1193500 RepID=A0A4R9M059_9LEPT|nr:hypothetical protein [Leptospira idonii]TGN19155.1 hypothetical protein EHS15_10360 [Leptospira idonii]